MAKQENDTYASDPHLPDISFKEKLAGLAQEQTESEEAEPAKELDSRQKIPASGNTFDLTSHGGAASHRPKRLGKIWHTDQIPGDINIIHTKINQCN